MKTLTSFLQIKIISNIYRILYNSYNYIVITNIVNKNNKNLYVSDTFALTSVIYTFTIFIYEYLWYAQRQFMKEIQYQYGAVHILLLLFILLVFIIGIKICINKNKLFLNRLFLLSTLMVFYIHVFVLITSIDVKEVNILFEYVNAWIVWTISLILSLMTYNIMDIRKI